ncbi:MAG: pyruvate carboxyltransferase [Alphaproteobacteria bacterium]|nr:pyruvate carboxyltransferase [Alphaproteobacteria bacterium]
MTDIVFQEVAMRDGLQIEPSWIPTADKVRLIDALSQMGFSRIEVSSFVSPRAVPGLRDADEVFAGIARNPSVVYVGLIANLRGAERALVAGADEINLVVSASETHNLANVQMSTDSSFAAFESIVERVDGSAMLVNGSIATSFGCPFEGTQAEERVLALIDRYLALGVDGITLADTTGMANPAQVKRLVARALEKLPASALTLHFHNTRGLGLANLLAAYEVGARRFDAALGGLGGCPFAPGASGNICSEDAINMAEEMGMRTGVDLPALLALSRTLPGLLGHDVPGQLMKAGRNCDLHPCPQTGLAA